MSRGFLSRLASTVKPTSSRQRPDISRAITEHLKVLLNTRQGDAMTVPGFGVIDFADIVHTLPASLPKLQAALRAKVLEFEPRLKGVTVRHVPEGDELVVRFEISAQLAEDGGRTLLRFQTRMTPGGKTEVT